MTLFLLDSLLQEVSMISCFTGTDSYHQEDCQEERFPPYLWRPGQPPAPQPQPQSPAPNSPSASFSSSQGGGEEDEALPSSLSGMARHFQARRAARAHGREADHLPTKLSRYSYTILPMETGVVCILS